MSTAKVTPASLSRDIQTEADAYRYWETLRWGEGARCPFCGETENVYLIVPNNGTSRKTAAGSMSERRVWKCRPCRKQFSVLTNTMMHATKIPVRVWVMVVFEACSAKNGISAREVERKYGVCPRTAWHMLHRIRQAMAGQDQLLGMMRGVIVADETWIGGKPERMNAKTRARWEGKNAEPVRVIPASHGRTRGTDKTPVFTMINRATGEIRSRVVPNVTAATLAKVLAEHVDMAGSQLWTDSGIWYQAVGREFQAHETVNHHVKQYVKKRGAGTNLAEAFFSQFKRWLTGTHHHVSREHLHRYANEHDFRRSTCMMSDYGRMRTLAKQVEGRLGYRRLASR